MKETVIIMDQKELFNGLVENDTISDTINDTTYLLSDNERTVFEEMQAHPKVTANELSEILNINLRNTKKIIEKLKEKGLVKRIGSRKTGHWEVVDR
jgi:predicted HTH transcriptional regulator